MNGIAGLLELAGAPFPPGPLLRAMTRATGTGDRDSPPEFQAPGVGLGVRPRCAADAARPAGPGASEDGSVVVCSGWPLGESGPRPESQARGRPPGTVGDA